MPSADQVPTKNTHSIVMRWHKWVVLTAGSTGSALRAVRPPNLHITPVVRRDHRGLLADEQMAGAVKHQAALLLRRLRRYETHIGSGDRLADSLCVSHVILLPFDIGLHVGRRHQPNGMAQCLELA